MDEITALHTATEGFDAVIAQVRGDQWDAATPCEGWTVSDLVSHVVGGNAMSVAMLDGASREDATPFLAGLPLGEDPVATFRDGAAAQIAAFEADGAMDRMVSHPMMDMPGSQAIQFRIGDLALHTWDLARAIGADETLNPELVEVVYERMAPMADMLGQVGVFGEGQSGTVGDQAGLQHKLLDLAGRRP
jgi:uncharacterized protein (TIGR03086 family)